HVLGVDVRHVAAGRFSGETLPVGVLTRELDLQLDVRMLTLEDVEGGVGHIVSLLRTLPGDADRPALDLSVTRRFGSRRCRLVLGGSLTTRHENECQTEGEHCPPSSKHFHQCPPLDVVAELFSAVLPHDRTIARTLSVVASSRASCGARTDVLPNPSDAHACLTAATL